MMPTNDEQPSKPLLALAILVLCAVIIVAFFAGRGCEAACTPPVVPPVTGIDAGPGEREIAERLDGALQASEARIEEIEREHAAELAAFNEAQREKYDALRADPDAADRFIRDFNRRLRDAQ